MVNETRKPVRRIAHRCTTPISRDALIEFASRQEDTIDDLFALLDEYREALASLTQAVGTTLARQAIGRWN